MALRKQTGSQDEQFARAAWDWAAEIGREDGLAVRWVVSPATRTGVLTVRCEVVTHLPAGGRAVASSLTADWPNASPQSLAGLLWTLVIDTQSRLDRTPAVVE